MNRTLSIFSRSRLVLALAALSLLMLQCAGLPKIGEEKSIDPFSLKCEGSGALLQIRNPSTGDLREEGPVALPEGVECKALARPDSAGVDAWQRQLRGLERIGHWRNLYAGSGSTLAAGNYVAGKREGEWRWQHENGLRMIHVSFREGEKEGREQAWFENGAKRHIGSFRNGLREGRWQEWIVPEAEAAGCVDEGEYQNDERSALWRLCEIDARGQVYLAFEGHFHRDIKDGPAAYYHPAPSGREPTVAMRGEHRRDSDCLEDPPEGDPDRCAFRRGRWQFFSPTGQLVMEGGYDASTGRRSGVWSEYYQSGERMATGSRDHVRVGQWSFYNKDGSFYGQFRFDGKNDFVPTYGILYDKGRRTAEGPLRSGIVRYDSESDLIELRAMIKDGAWIEYHPDGTKSGEGQFSGPFRLGHWRHYDTSGQLTSEGEYLNDRKQGLWRERDGSGRWVEREYMLGRVRN